MHRARCGTRRKCNGPLEIPRGPYFPKCIAHVLAEKRIFPHMPLANYVWTMSASGNDTRSVVDCPDHLVALNKERPMNENRVINVPILFGRI